MRYTFDMYLIVKAINVTAREIDVLGAKKTSDCFKPWHCI